MNVIYSNKIKAVAGGCSGIAAITPSYFIRLIQNRIGFPRPFNPEKDIFRQKKSSEFI